MPQKVQQKLPLWTFWNITAFFSFSRCVLLLFTPYHGYLICCSHHKFLLWSGFRQFHHVRSKVLFKKWFKCQYVLKIHRTSEWADEKVNGLCLDQAIWVEGLVGVIALCSWATHLTSFVIIQNPKPGSSGNFLSVVCSCYRII